jgi:SpoVK/Ycf46/Vps4 family AAA+-type ATPase
VLERDDLLGPKASKEAIARSSAYDRLIAMEGLQEVKASVEKLLTLVAENAKREDDEKPMLDVALNRVFLGNPGTGKTTVAALYANILADIGLLSKGEVILKNTSDFIGSALGTSENITRGILQQAEGCVLVIDEAYGLNPSPGSAGTGTADPYKTAVIDTIVEQVQGVPGEDRAVVLLGYRKQMDALMAAANPGLSWRFQLENAFEFSDYNDGSLVRILRTKAIKDGLEVDLSTALFAVEQLAQARAMPNFGNTGAVNNLLSTPS